MQLCFCELCLQLMFICWFGASFVQAFWRFLFLSIFIKSFLTLSCSDNNILWHGPSFQWSYNVIFLLRLWVKESKSFHQWKPENDGNGPITVFTTELFSLWTVQIISLIIIGSSCKIIAIRHTTRILTPCTNTKCLDKN